MKKPHYISSDLNHVTRHPMSTAAVQLHCEVAACSGGCPVRSVGTVSHLWASDPVRPERSASSQSVGGSSARTSSGRDGWPNCS